MIAVAAVDNDPLVLEAVPGWLGKASPDIAVVHGARSVADLLRTLTRPVDVVLLDIWLGDGTAVGDNVRDLIAQTDAAVVTLSNDDVGRLILESIEAGALSYVSKSAHPAEVAAVIRAAAHGEQYMTAPLAFALRSDRRPTRPALSTQETEALRLYASGLRLHDVAKRMNVKPSTAKGYLDRVRAKYGDLGRVARTKMELRDRAAEDGIVPEHPQARHRPSPRTPPPSESQSRQSRQSRRQPK